MLCVSANKLCVCVCVDSTRTWHLGLVRTNRDAALSLSSADANAVRAATIVSLEHKWAVMGLVGWLARAHCN